MHRCAMWIWEPLLESVFAWLRALGEQGSKLINSRNSTHTTQVTELNTHTHTSTRANTHTHATQLAHLNSPVRTHQLNALNLTQNSTHSTQPTGGNRCSRCINLDVDMVSSSPSSSFEPTPLPMCFVDCAASLSIGIEPLKSLCKHPFGHIFRILAPRRSAS